ncbi:MAG: hypothetical protein M5U14_20655 [Acidimicrobiia bacterium]|nr:hypothetical protein [Acidimicrobiia bacterium]
MDDEASRPPPSPPGEPVDVEALRAERDALRAELEAVSGSRRPRRRVRRATAVVLVVLFGVLFLVSGVGIWLRRSTLNDDVWADRVVPLGREPAVQEALARWTVDQLMVTVDPENLFEEVLPERGRILAGPLSSAVRGFVADRVDGFFASERFEELWAGAATRAHDAAVAVLRDERPNVAVEDEQVTINLIPVIDAVLTDILDAAPGLVGSDVDLPEVSVEDVPEAARERLGEALGVDLGDGFGTVTVYDGGRLSTAQDLVRLFDRLVVLTALLTVAVGAGALWVSPRRRRTLFQLLGAAALVCVVIRRVSFTLQDEVVDLVRKDENREAASVVVAAFVDPLTGAAATVLWIIAGVAAVAAVTGPYDWAVRVRGTVAQGARSAAGVVRAEAAELDTVRWIVDHRDVLRITGYVLGALVLWFADLTWLTILVVGVLVAAWQVGLDRLVRRVPAPRQEPARQS